MVSKKHRNKTRRLRGGGGCSSKPMASSVVEPIERNAAKTARNLKRAARTAARAAEKAARNSEKTILRQQAKIDAGKYANSEIQKMGIINNAAQERDRLYHLYLGMFEMKMTENMLAGRPITTGLDNLF